jgi:nucleotide-binding universal stress UspA family protein
VDSSEGSRRAVKFAMDRAKVNSWRVTIVHVIHWSPYSFSSPQENDTRHMRRQAEIEHAQTQIIGPILTWIESDMPDHDVEVTSEIRHGRPSEMLADLADQGPFDLLVVGRTGESNLRAAIFGSTPYRLVQHAPVAVVVVP